MTRVAIVTTVDRRSAIARATLRTAEELAEVADVTIFAEPTSQPLHSSLPLRTIDDGALRGHDHVVTVLGDSPFHVQTFHVARRIPSVVILHDVLMAHLVAWCMPLDDLRSELGRWYGPDTASNAIHSAGSMYPAWDSPNALDTPLFESAIESARGVIVHSRFAAEHVSASTIVPVKMVPLAYEPPWGHSNGQPAIQGSMLLTLGNVNVNKCHELVIEALADLSVPTIRYVIAGSISDERRTHLVKLAAALRVGNQVEIIGSVGDDRAAQLLGEADACVNLRSPAIEGGSASLVEQMAAGKSVIVFDHGCYADAPDDCVIKLPVAATPQSLADAIRAILVDPVRRAALGARAEAHARLNHSFAGYAASLLDFLGNVDAAETHNRVARRVAATTRAWGMPHGSPLAHRWASAIVQMTDAPSRDW
jgi:glycosyltransferase involved in cell wall biosynthesis